MTGTTFSVSRDNTAGGFDTHSNECSNLCQALGLAKRLTKIHHAPKMAA